MTQSIRDQREQRTQEFMDTNIDHARATQVREKAVFYLTKCPGTRMVNIVGPSGVGKSHLVAQLQSGVLAYYAKEIRENPDRIPFLRTNLEYYGFKRFTYASLFSMALEEMGDPFARMPATFRERVEHELIARKKYRNQAENELAMRKRLKREFLRFGTMVWCLDEAQYILMAASDPSEHQLSVLKSIAQSGPAKLLLVGPPALRDKLLCSSEVARRGVTICFTRYKVDEPKDVAAFAAAAEKLFKLMRFASTPAVKDNLDMLYAGSLGCIGVLKEWFQRSMASAMERHENLDEVQLTIDDLVQNEVDEFTRGRLIDDIEAMERAESLSDRDAFADRVLGSPKLAKKAGSSRNRAAGGVDFSTLNAEDIATLQKLIDAGVLRLPTKPKQKRQRVGVPLPQRYKVGIDEQEATP